MFSYLIFNRLWLLSRWSVSVTSTRCLTTSASLCGCSTGSLCWLYLSWGARMRTGRGPSRYMQWSFMFWTAAYIAPIVHFCLKAPSLARNVGCVILSKWEQNCVHIQKIAAVLMCACILSYSDKRKKMTNNNNNNNRYLYSAYCRSL